MENWKELKVHPVAELFPMMGEEELEALAADILANGLIHPLVVDEENRLVDGRNRLEACKRAEVVPQFVALNGIDAESYIIATNIERRNLNPSQKAMYREKVHSLSKNLPASSKLAGARARAHFVLNHAPDLADKVIAGFMSVAQAYEETRARREALQSDDAKLARLKESYADLAEMVVEERLSLEEARAAAAERRAKEDAERQAAEQAARTFADQFNQSLFCLDPGGHSNEHWAGRLASLDSAHILQGVDWSAERLRRIVAVLELVIRAKENENETQTKADQHLHAGDRTALRKASRSKQPVG